VLVVVAPAPPAPTDSEKLAPGVTASAAVKTTPPPPPPPALSKPPPPPPATTNTAMLATPGGTMKVLAPTSVKEKSGKLPGGDGGGSDCGSTARGSATHARKTTRSGALHPRALRVAARPSALERAAQRSAMLGGVVPACCAAALRPGLLARRRNVPTVCGAMTCARQKARRWHPRRRRRRCPQLATPTGVPPRAAWRRPVPWIAHRGGGSTPACSRAFGGDVRGGSCLAGVKGRGGARARGTAA
jgi:hypothetical protein